MTIPLVLAREELVADVKSPSNFAGQPRPTFFLSSLSIDVHAPKNYSVTSQETGTSGRISTKIDQASPDAEEADKRIQTFQT